MTIDITAVSTEDMLAQLTLRQQAGVQELANLRAQRDALNAQIKSKQAEQDTLDKLVSSMTPRTRKKKAAVATEAPAAPAAPPPQIV